MDHALQQALKDAFERSEDASMRMVLAVALALMKKNHLTADDILAEYDRPPHYTVISPSERVDMNFVARLRRP